MSFNVGSAIAYLDLDISKFSKGLTDAEAALDKFGSTSKGISGGLTALGDTFTNTGKTLTASVTLPVVGLGTSAVKMSMDFDAAMSKVQAISAATSDEMVLLRDKAIEMGAKTKFSAKESAEAFTYMAMAGWDAQQMVDGISGIMSLAAADGLDLATTSDIVTDALTAFGLQASDSAHFADVLAQASSSANTNVSMLGESFKYVAPVAGTLGYSIEDIAMALGLMANAGVKGSQAGTALRATLSRLVKPTDKAAMIMEEYGISLTDSEGKMKTFAQFCDELRGALGNLTEAEQANVAATLFGQEAMSGMLAIVNASAEDYNKLSDAINNAEGRAESMAGTMQDNLAGSLEELSGAVETLLIKLGAQLTPTIENVTEILTKLADWLDTLNEEQINQIIQIAAILAMLGPLAIGLGSILKTVGTLITAIPAITSLLQGPVGIAIGVIIAMLGALLSTMNLTEEGMVEFSDEVSSTFGEAFETIKQIFQEVMEVLPEFVPLILELVQALVPFLLAIVPILTDVLTLITPILELLTPIVEILSILMNLISGFIPLSLILIKFLTGALNLIVNLITNTVKMIITMIQFWIDFAVGLFTGDFEKIQQAWEKVWFSIFDVFKGVIDDVWALGEGLFTYFLDSFSKIGEGFKNAFTGLVNFGKDVDGSHSAGLSRVPYNGYRAQLHEGERVLTAQENKEYSRGQKNSGDTFIFNSPKAIDEYEAARLLKKTRQEVEFDF